MFLTFNGTAIVVLINFGIMLWILNRFLFKPIGKILDERSAQIKQELEQSEEHLSQAEADRAEAKRILTQARAESQAAVSRAMDQAEQFKRELELKIRADAETFKAKAQLALESERKAVLDHLRQEASQVAMVGAEKILEDVLDDAMRQRLKQAALLQIQPRDVVRT